MLPKRSTCNDTSRKSTLAMERGLGRNRRKQMTLIYRGQKYVQSKEAAKKQHAELTYRGKSYTS